MASVYSVVSSNGNFKIFSIQPTNLLLDISGYFSENAGYYFYPLPPFRVFDTRPAEGGAWADVKTIVETARESGKQMVPRSAKAVSFASAIVDHANV